MEFWLWLVPVFLILLLINDIRERLPKSGKHWDFGFVIEGREGFLMRSEHMSEGSFVLDFTGGNRVIGRSFYVMGEIVPYHEQYREKQKLKFSGHQTITFHPVENLVSSKIGFILGREKYDVHIWLPIEVHAQLISDFRLNPKRQIECQIAENKRKRGQHEQTYGIYRLEIDGQAI